jgi:hypothetical protein
MSIWNDLVESCRDAVGREVNDLNDVADVVDELNREVCRLKKELSKLHQPTVSEQVNEVGMEGHENGCGCWMCNDLRGE